MTDRITTPTPWDAQDQLEVLTFDLHGETLALEAFLVREIVDLLPDLPAIFRSLDAPARSAEPHLTLIH